MEADNINDEEKNKNNKRNRNNEKALATNMMRIATLGFLVALVIPAAAGFDVAAVAFDDGFNSLWGHSNLVRSPDGNAVRLLLDRFSGSGFISSSLYNYGFFSANIKLPSDYTAGICVAFYTSNGDVFEKTHDELDFEFLGNVEGKPWRFQTNLYGNGSTSRGREERYRLWFDPTKDFHRYSILWTHHNIIFYIDEVPIREIVKTDEMGSDFPSKPMSLYATIWDASNWATNGGKYKVNYKYSPFVAEFKDLVLQGCPESPIQVGPTDPSCGPNIESEDFASLTPSRRASMSRFRRRFMYYSYCYDTLRYPVPLPECVIVPEEKRLFKETGRLKFGSSHRSRRARARAAALAERTLDF